MHQVFITKELLLLYLQATTFTVAYYEAAGQAFAVATQCTVFIYGSEFKKGTNGMVGSLEAEDEIFLTSLLSLKISMQLMVLTWLKLDGLK
jgi:hypothetical protein